MLQLVEIAEIGGALLAGILGHRYGIRFFGKEEPQGERERVIPLLQEIREKLALDTKAAKEHRIRQEKQLAQIGEALDRSHDLTKQALFELIDWIKKEPPGG